MKFLKSLFARAPQAGAVFEAPSTPRAFAAIGDIHGRADLLEKLLAQLDPGLVVCVGDYVDRGDQSAEVLRLLRARPDIICLKGNHEEMLLDFLARPETHGRRWLRNGGLQTLASFGVAGLTETSRDDHLLAARDRLAGAMGEDLVAWIADLPSSWLSGTVGVVHAGADPARPFESQPADILHWGHADFMTTLRRDGIWIVHGHTIVDTPRMENGRIAIDTGAYATGRLTAAIFRDADVSFQTT
jgi:serine/threonine protein phosphatase 1